MHLVVWTKFELEDDPATDDLTPRARREIDDYVTRTFRSRVSSEQVSILSSGDVREGALSDRRWFGSRTGNH